MATAPVELKKPAPPAINQPDPWRSLRSEVDRLFDRFTGDFNMPSFGRLFDNAPLARFAPSAAMPAPAIDVTEDADAFKVTAELPGLAEKDVDISVNNGLLTLKGEKKQETEKQEKNYYLSERSYGSFARSFALPDTINTDGITAAFTNGVLTITLPKKAEAKAEPKKIEVKAA